MFRSTIFRTLSANTLILGLGLVTSVLLSRGLLPAGRGAVAAATLWPGLLVYFGSFGLIDAIVYFSAQHDIKTDAIFSAALVSCLVQSIITVLIGYIAMPILLLKQEGWVVQLAQLYLLVIPISLLGQYNLSLLRGQLKFSTYNLLRLIVPILYFVTVCVLWALKHVDVTTIVALQFILNCILLVSSSIALIVNHIPIRFMWDFSVERRMLGYGSKVFFGTLFSAANLRLDQVLIAAWLPSEQLGLYAAAVAISGITNVLAQSVAVVMTPTIAQQTNEAARIEKVYEAFERYWTLNIFGTVAFAIMLPWVIPLLYGRDFVPAVLTAEVLLLASLSLNTRIVLIGAMQAFGEPQFASISEGLASILTVAILLLLIPSTGILGAAIASAAAYSASVSYLVFIFYRRHKVSPMKLLQPRPYLIWNLLSKYIPRNVTSPR